MLTILLQIQQFCSHIVRESLRGKQYLESPLAALTAIVSYFNAASSIKVGNFFLHSDRRTATADVPVVAKILHRKHLHLLISRRFRRLF